MRIVYHGQLLGSNKTYDAFILVCFTITMTKSMPKSHFWVQSAYFSLHFLVNNQS